MSDKLTQTNFFNKMHFLLSFHYSEPECLDILEDYNEWFEGEKSGGKSEEEICSRIGSPEKIVHQICSESPPDSWKLSILVNNAFLQFICLVTIRMIMELCVWNFCNKRGYSYLYFALFMNSAFFMAAAMIGKSKSGFQIKSRKNLLMDFLAIFFIILNTYMVLNVKIPIGHYFTYAYEIVICILFIAILTESRGILNDSLNIYMIVCKALAVISLLLFMINQMQMLYTDINQWKDLFLGSVAVYAEIFLLVLFFYLFKGKGR